MSFLKRNKYKKNRSGVVRPDTFRKSPIAGLIFVKMKLGCML